jgi:hypothetical protein
MTAGALNSVSGRGFSATPGINGGAVVQGATLQSAATITLTADETAYVTGGGFATTLAATFIPSSNGSVAGRGFTSSVIAVGGAVVLGRGFGSAFTSTLKASEKLEVTGRGFATSPSIAGVGSTGIQVTGRGFSSGLQRIALTGRGFSAQLIAQFESNAVFTEAVAMNLKNNRVSRYQNFPFSHLARIGNTYYGVTSEGLYEMSGLLDIETPVNGMAWGKAYDFGVFNSKNVPYMYMNGDDDYTVSAYVDASGQPEFTSAFSGRRVKLARGNKGRYWSFKVEGIKKLQGIEYMPDNLSRRVK